MTDTFSGAGSIRAIAVLLVLTIGLTLTLKYLVTPPYGQDVQARFIERLKLIPSQAPALLSRENLVRWLADNRNAAAVNGYVCPVLFPLDILFLVSLGFLTALASSALASRVGYLASWPVWVMWAVPVLYMLSDLAEDVFIALIFKSALALTDASYGLLRALTTIKLVTVSIAIGQVVILVSLFAALRMISLIRG